jgi:hypothetical protein
MRGENDGRVLPIALRILLGLTSTKTLSALMAAQCHQASFIEHETA